MLSATPPDVRWDGCYNISATARALGVNRSTVHRWIKAEILKPHQTKIGLRAMITGKQIINVWHLMS